MTPASRVLALLLVALSVAVPVGAQDAELGGGGSGVRVNEFGPGGGMCMDACGPGCPDTCEKEEFTRCHESQNLVVSGVRFTCGIHPACSVHDDCLEQCYIRYEYNLGYEKVDFVIGDCQRGCHFDALDWATEMTGSRAEGVKVVTSWARGHGPYTGSSTWEYTKSSPDSPEKTKSCTMCESCEDGSCKYTPEACPPCLSCGDVHVSTLDSLRYSYQGVGELVLFENASRSHVAQIRTRSSGDSVSLNSAVAVGVLGDAVAVHLEPELRIAVNGEIVELPPGERRSLAGGGTLGRDGGQGTRITVRWPDGSVVQARLFGTRFLNVGGFLAPELAGQVRGLAGNFDGDPHNDLVTRDGERLPRNVDWDVLYGRYGNSWRVTQEESLFHYLDGETTATFTDLDFPRRRLRLEDLDEEALAFGERICRERGVEHPRLFQDCVFDVAVTRDPSFAEGHKRSLPPAASGPASHLAGTRPGDITLSAPASVPTGTQVEVGWTGQRRPGDVLAIAPRGAPPDSYPTHRLVGQGPTERLYAPEAPGAYEVRYLRGEEIAAVAQLEVRPVSASLRAPRTASAGEAIEVDWTGPGGPSDYLAVADPDAERRHHRYRYTRAGSPLSLSVPDEPGSYELRYVQMPSRRVLARRPIEVLPVTATLTAPAQAPAGSAVEVVWAGPDNPGDYLAVADPDAEGRRHHRYRYTRAGSPLTLSVPDEPGTYELRYIQGQSRNVLARRTIEVLPVAATLAAPPRAPSGSEIEVRWTGPDNAGDYVSVAAPGAQGNQYHRYRYTRVGSPLTVPVPDEPGTYEIRYVQGQSRNVLARRPIEVLPVTATLEAPARAAAGSDVEIHWTGPDNPRDYIAVAETGAEGRQHLGYRYTRAGSPLTLSMPDEPGTYELRYIQTQSRNVLARRTIRVTP